MTTRQVRIDRAVRCHGTVTRARGAGAFLSWWQACRATAAVEFAVASPMLIIMLGGAADYGLAQYNRSLLANAVSAGAQYAYLTGTSVITSNITTVIQNTSNLPNAATTVTVVYSSISPGVPSPGWYCITGTAPTVTSSTSGGVCGDGSSAGYYISMKATYTYSGVMGGFLSLATNTMSEQATVKVQ
jgi:Flp pilus assembly protein TadG